MKDGEVGWHRYPRFEGWHWVTPWTTYRIGRELGHDRLACLALAMMLPVVVPAVKLEDVDEEQTLLEDFKATNTQ